MTSCCRCGRPAPPGTPEPQVIERGDEVEVHVAVPRDWFPIDYGPELACSVCADDDEINRWLLAEAERRP